MHVTVIELFFPFGGLSCTASDGNGRNSSGFSISSDTRILNLNIIVFEEFCCTVIELFTAPNFFKMGE